MVTTYFQLLCTMIKIRFCNIVPPAAICTRALDHITRCLIMAVSMTTTWNILIFHVKWRNVFRPPLLCLTHHHPSRKEANPSREALFPHWPIVTLCPLLAPREKTQERSKGKKSWPWSPPGTVLVTSFHVSAGRSCCLLLLLLLCDALFVFYGTNTLDMD